MKTPYAQCAGSLIVFTLLLGVAPRSAADLITAWGQNTQGQTNVPSGLTNIAAVATGADHNLALRDDGTVAAWGNNWYGQTTVPAAATNIVAIAAGGSHSLCLKADGTVLAWGYNSYQQTNVPVGLNNVVAIAAGTTHSLALKADGTVVAWGNNTSGQTNIPPDLVNVVAISAGGFFNLALKADGTVVAWGHNFYSQTNVPPSLSNVVAIAAGGYHSLALKADGTLAAWGANAYGQSSIPASLNNVIGLAAGGYHSLAIRADGTVAAWGRTNEGQTLVPPGLTNLVAVAGGFYHSVALSGNGAPRLTSPLLNRAVGYGMTVQFRATVSGAPPFSYQWQFNGTDILGATNAVLVLTNVQPEQVGLYTVVVSNALGTMISPPARLLMMALWITSSPQSQSALVGSTVSFSVNVQSTLPFRYQWLFNEEILWDETNTTLTLRNVDFAQDGVYTIRVSNDYGSESSPPARLKISQLAAWGWNGYGQTNVPAGLTNIVAISASEYDNLALTRDGTVVAWGNNGTNVPASLTNLMAVAVGVFHRLALTSNGTVIAWGDNSNGQTNVPYGLTNVMAIAAGGYHSLALKADGTVVGWGYNGSEQTNVPAGLNNVVGIAAGANFSAALKGDGRVVVWGYNGYGQTNVPDGLTNVVAIAAGYGHSLALLANGTVAAWGRDYEAQIYVPFGLSNVVAIAGGDYHSLAFKADGIIVAWGNNAYGQGSVPAGVSNIVAIAAGGSHNLALGGSGLPYLTAPLVDRTAIAGLGAPFYISATGRRPLSYQWRLDGLAIPGATNAILSRNQAQLSGHYSVQVSNPLGTVISSDAFLNLAPLQLLSQPQSQTNWLFGVESFSVSVESGLPVSYQWRFNGSDLSDDARISGSRTDTLSISGLQFSDIGEYLLVASNPLGSVTSEVARLVVTNSLPILTCQPVNQQVDAGYAATFNVCVASVLPYSVQWYHDGLPLFGATSNTLYLPNVWTNDAGNYWCLVSNRAGVVPSATVLLQVSLRPPTIFGQPSDMEVDAGMNAFFSVGVSGAPPPSYQWQFNGVDVPGATNYIYYLSSVSSNNVGTYRVVVSNITGVAISSNANLTVLYRPPFILVHPSSQAVLAGSYVSFLCVVQGGPRPDLQWFFNGQPIAGATNSQLYFLVSSTNQAGNYWLAASNEFGTAISAPATLAVIVAAPAFRVQPVSRGVVAGSGVVFFGDAAGHPPPSYQWQFNGANMPSATNYTLWLPDTATNQTGDYVVIAWNEAGSITSAVARLVVSPAGPLDHWQWRQPLPQGNDLLCGTYANGVFMLMGKSGAHVRSADRGVTWQAANRGNGDVHDMAFGNGVFVGVGRKITSPIWLSTIQSSPDGIHWTDYDLDLDQPLQTVAFGNKRFVAASWNRFLVSTNGVDWTMFEDTSGLDIYKIRFGNGRFVALTTRPDTIALSEDGLNWSSAVVDSPGGFNDFAFASGKFVLIGNHYTNATTRTYALVSTNGESWNMTTICEDNWFTYLTAGSNVFLARSYPYSSLVMASSEDGLNWTVHNTGLSNQVLGATADAGQIVAFGDKGSIFTSTDYQNWTTHSPGSPVNLRAIAHGNNTYVAVGNEGLVFTSSNRVDWVRRQAPTIFNLRSIAFGNDRFVAVGDIATNQAVVLVSADGIDWWGPGNNINSGLYSVAFGKGRFVAVGWYGAIATSPDGFSWNLPISTTTARLNAITWNGEMFVAVGRNGAIVTSTNGLNWSSRYSGTSYFLQGVAYGNGLFVAAGQAGTLTTSTNGIYWTSISGSDSPFLYAGIEDVQFANGQFLALGDVNNEALLASSVDGELWTEHKLSCQNPLRNLVYAENYILAVGNNETILQSDFFGPPRLRVRSLGLDGFEFSVDAEVGRTHRLQASDDLRNWEDIFSFSNTRVTTVFLDSEAALFSRRFYRVVTP